MLKFLDYYEKKENNGSKYRIIYYWHSLSLDYVVSTGIIFVI